MPIQEQYRDFKITYSNQIERQAYRVMIDKHYEDLAKMGEHPTKGTEIYSGIEGRGAAGCGFFL